MNKYIYALVESYYNDTEQLNRIIKDTKAFQRAQEQAKEARKEFIVNVLGKVTYNRFANNGTFAPVPMSALRIDKRDFLSLSADADPVKTDKMIERLALKYYRNEFSFIDNGYGEYELKTDIVFKTLDEIIDFFYNILTAYKKVFRTEEINWTKIVKKFRMYL